MNLLLRLKLAWYAFMLRPQSMHVGYETSRTRGKILCGVDGAAACFTPATTVVHRVRWRVYRCTDYLGGFCAEHAKPYVGTWR